MQVTIQASMQAEKEDVGTEKLLKYCLMPKSRNEIQEFNVWTIRKRL